MEAGEEAFAEVAADDLFRVADGREVDAAVPLEDKLKIIMELPVDRGRDWGIADIGIEEDRDCFRRERRHRYSAELGLGDQAAASEMKREKRARDAALES